jgi:hypothetical protein
MTKGHARKVETAGLVLACGIAIGPAQPVMAGELGPTSTGSVTINVSVAPRLLVETSGAQTVYQRERDQSFCMLSPSATGLYRLFIATQSGSPVNVSWQDGPQSLPRSLNSDRGEPFQARRTWNECRPSDRGSSHLLVTPVRSSGGLRSEVVLLVAPE